MPIQRKKTKKRKTKKTKKKGGSIKNLAKKISTSKFTKKVMIPVATTYGSLYAASQMLGRTKAGRDMATSIGKKLGPMAFKTLKSLHKGGKLKK